MRDVDDGVLVEVFVQRRHDERAAGLAEDVEDLCDLFGCGSCQPTENAEAGWSTNPGVGSLVGQGFEDLFADLLRMLTVQLSISAFGVLIECVRHGADGFVVSKVERTTCAIVVLPTSPCAVQRVLKDGELVWIVAHVVDEPREEHRRNLGSSNADRTFNGGSSLVACQTWDQIFALVDCFRETRELSAASKEVGAHG